MICTSTHLDTWVNSLRHTDGVMDLHPPRCKKPYTHHGGEIKMFLTNLRFKTSLGVKIPGHFPLGTTIATVTCQ